MSLVPRSEQFDDVYFSVNDGLAETRHVFIEGNRLEQRWGQFPKDKEFTICETGFGTGLNFLAAAHLWKKFNLKHLNYISFEKYPVSANFIKEHLTCWQEDIGAQLNELIQVYPYELNGTKKIKIGNNIHLTLIFCDVNDELGKLDTEVDCWFLDGFKPSSNPDMWSEYVFQNMYRLSIAGTTFATFTSAGFVRRGLKSAGFLVRKVKGYGRKREMTIGEII